MTTTNVADGVYRVTISGSCMEVAHVRNGRVIWSASEADLGTMRALHDHRTEWFHLPDVGPDCLFGDAHDAFCRLYCPDCYHDMVAVYPLDQD